MIGPICDTVTRIGRPPVPSIMSQKRQGQPRSSQSSMPNFTTRLRMFSVSSPACAMPVTSPLTSAMNTGTPACENASAITLSVTVLPVPEAPVIKP